MKTRAQHGLFILLLAAPVLAGCGRHIVRAESPSVTTPPPVGRPTIPVNTEAVVEPVAPPELPQPDPTAAAPEIVAGPVPAAPAAPRPRPSNPASAQPEPAQPKPVAPQISAALNPNDVARLKRLTTEQVVIAERNWQQAQNRKLNPSQKDLFDKIRGFLDQADVAIRANDWVRAQNLAEKAQLLSIELTKSL